MAPLVDIEKVERPKKKMLVDSLPRQQRAYVLNLIAQMEHDPQSANQTKAAEAAGYSKKSAYAAASRLMKNVKVKAAIDEFYEQATEKAEVTIDRIVQELASIAFAQMSDYCEWDENGNVKFLPCVNSQDKRTIQELINEGYLDPRKQPAIANIEKTVISKGDDVLQTTLRFKLHDKLGAIKLLAQYKGMLDQVVKQQHSGKVDLHHKDVTQMTDAEVDQELKNLVEEHKRGVTGDWNPN